MTDITVTAANVVPGSAARVERGTAGEAINAGQWVYFNSTDNKYYLADNNHATAAVRSPRGMAVSTASGAGQAISVVTSGDVTMNAGLTAGDVSFLSDTAGAMCPVADLASPTGQYKTVVGIARSTTVFRVGIIESGVASA